MSLASFKRAAGKTSPWVLWFGVALSGCSGKGDGSGGPESEAGSALLIDDLEDGNGNAGVILGQPNTWWVASDGSGTIAPPANAVPSPQSIPGGRSTSKRAMRLTGGGFATWGADVSVGMAEDGPHGPFMDAGELSGIRFWARTGDTNESSLRFQIQDRQTQPAGGVCDPNPDSEERCYNGFGTSLEPLDTEWRFYELSFSGLSQREGWGYRAESVDASAIRNVEWLVEGGSSFDFWIDDVSFYR